LTKLTHKTSALQAKSDALHTQASTVLTGLLLKLLCLLHGLLVGKLGLHTLAGTKLLDAQLSSKVLPTDSQSSLLVELLRLHTASGVLVELLSCLLIRRLQATGADVTLEHTQIALTLGLNNRLTAATKRTGANRLSLIGHALHLRRPLGLPKLGCQCLLNEGGHVLSSLSATKHISPDTLCRAHLKLLKLWGVCLKV
jgi:hypothetical protein